MPTPGENESRSDFVSRCIPIVLDDGTAEDQDQAIAICNSMFDDKGKQMNAHATLIDAIKSRGDDCAAINTADWYVRKAISECGEGLFSKTFGTSSDQLLNKAAQQLVFSHPDLTTYKQHSSAKISTLSDLEKALPEGSQIFGDEETIEKALKHAAILDFHILTTPQEDRDTDILKTEGAIVDPEMPTLWQHLQTVPLGKVIAQIEHSKVALKLASVLLDINEFTSDVIKLVEAGVLRWSHGFRALEFEERKANDPTKGFEVTKFEIMEESRVSVPSNTAARTELFTLVGRNKLTSDYWKAVGKHYYDERPAQMAVTESTQMMLKLGDSYEVKVNAQNPDDAIKMFNAVTEENPEQVVELGEKTMVGLCEEALVALADEPAEAKEEATEVEEKAQVGTTGEANGHSHTVNLDDDGNGKTGNADGHSHDVEEFKVQEEDGHTHALARGDLEERQADVEEKATQDTVEFSIVPVPKDIEGGDEYLIVTTTRTEHVPNELVEQYVKIHKELTALDFLKAGRVISARHLATLKAVHEDLEEVAGMDKLPKAAHALCERCVRKLGDVIKAADKPVEDDEDKPKPDEEKPKTVGGIYLGVPTVWKPTSKEAAEILLGSADDALLKQVHDTIATLLAIEKQNEKAREYRDSSAYQELIET